uniref:Uncharacterized protein n=1 Tax=Vitrella brassicaformis TaxID=1169539 RepID=A0A7S1JQ58_9ALVE
MLWNRESSRQAGKQASRQAGGRAVCVYECIHNERSGRHPSTHQSILPPTDRKVRMAPLAQSGSDKKWAAGRQIDPSMGRGGREKWTDRLTMPSSIRTSW